MSNTDGEDTQKVSLGELLLNAGTRIVDLEKQSNDQVEIITHLEKQFASLREQLARAEQQIKSLNEIIENLMNDEKDDMINLREQLATEQDMRSTAEFANRMIIKDLNEKLKQWKEDFDKLHATSVLLLQQIKQKEDNNQEFKNALKDLISIVDYYHIRSVKYTEMPYKNWNAVIDKAKNLSA